MSLAILHVIGQMVRGGAERQLLNLCTQLAQRGWSQKVVSFQPACAWDSILVELGIPLLKVPPSRFKAMRLLDFLAIISREQPRIVHSWSHHTNVYSAFARRFKKFRFIASLRHNPLFDPETGKYIGKISHLASYRFADCILSNSSVSLGMARAVGLRPEREALVSNIVSPQKRGNPEKQTGCPRIITIGSLTSLKGHRELFKSLSMLHQKGHRFHLDIIGDGPERGSLETFAHSLNISDSVRFLGESDRLGDVLGECQILVHPSLMEGLSNSVLEGMAAGLAVCATSVGATPQYVENEVTGLLAPPNNPAALAHQLGRLLSNAPLRSALGQAATERIAKLCSPAAVAAEYEDCYNRVIGVPNLTRAGGPRVRGFKILMYHNLLDRPRPDLPVACQQMTVDGFRRQMEVIAEDVLQPQEVDEALSKGGRLPNGILITFDDGAAGLASASKILAEFRLSGVAFVCPGNLQSGLWFYRLANLISVSSVGKLEWRGFELPLESAQHKIAAYTALYRLLACELDHLREMSLRELEGVLDCHELPLPPALKTLDERGLLEVASNSSLYFANHSWSHPNLTGLPAQDVEKEINSADQWLKGSGLPILPWFAFPEGYYDRRTLRVVKSYGLIPFGADATDSQPEITTRIGIYSMDAFLPRFRMKLFLKAQHTFANPCCN